MVSVLCMLTDKIRVFLFALIDKPISHFSNKVEEKFRDRWTVFSKRVAFMEEHHLKYLKYDGFFITCLLELKRQKDKTRYNIALKIFENNNVPISLIESFITQRKRMDFGYKIKRFLYRLLKW